MTSTSIPFDVMTVQIGHKWKVPSLGGGGTSSNAKDIGWYSGYMTAAGAASIPFSGGEICGYLGMLDGSMLLYPEQIILDHEICMDVYEKIQAVEFEKTDLALDVIEAVGPGGHFLRQKHTRKHIRDFLLDPISDEIYIGDPPRPSREIALEQFNHINETHHPEPLPEEKLVELDRILAAADKAAENLG